VGRNGISQPQLPDIAACSLSKTSEGRMRGLASLLLALAVVAPVTASAKVSPIVARAVADPARPADQKSVDALRKPADTLAFAGVRPGMVVGEFYPGGGYFTRMLSDVVGPRGHVYGIENEGWKGAE